MNPFLNQGENGGENYIRSDLTKGDQERDFDRKEGQIEERKTKGCFFSGSWGEQRPWEDERGGKGWRRIFRTGFLLSVSLWN